MAGVLAVVAAPAVLVAVVLAADVAFAADVVVLLVFEWFDWVTMAAIAVAVGTVGLVALAALPTETLVAPWQSDQAFSTLFDDVAVAISPLRHLPFDPLLVSSYFLDLASAFDQDSAHLTEEWMQRTA